MTFSMRLLSGVQSKVTLRPSQLSTHMYAQGVNDHLSTVVDSSHMKITSSEYLAESESVKNCHLICEGAEVDDKEYEVGRCKQQSVSRLLWLSL